MDKSAYVIFEALLQKHFGEPVNGYHCHTDDWDCCGKIFAEPLWIQETKHLERAIISYRRDC